jgi:hypothetical protein
MVRGLLYAPDHHLVWDATSLAHGMAVSSSLMPAYDLRTPGSGRASTTSAVSDLALLHLCAIDVGPSFDAARHSVKDTWALKASPLDGMTIMLPEELITKR